MSNTFMAMVYSTLKEHGVDTSDMTPTECVKKFNELNGKDNLKKEEIDNNKKEQITKLVQTLNELKKIKLKELVDLIKNFQPVELEINDKKILAAFDKYSAEKNLYTRGNSTHKGFTFKLNNIKELPQFIKDSTYAYSKKEIGKNTRQHKGVKDWHYFKKDVQVGDDKYDVVINVRDKGDKQYVYEVTFK
ncbi:MAG: hypothetical protein ACI4PF_06725 [Christensenellales bacterium]